MNTASKDILTQIAERDAAAPKTVAMKHPAWKVSLGNGRISYGHTYHGARKVAARYNRLFSTNAAYAVR